MGLEEEVAERLVLEKVVGGVSILSLLFSCSLHSTGNSFIQDLHFLLLSDFFYTAIPEVGFAILANVAPEWLHSFPLSAYDVFFLNAPVFEVVQTLVPCLHHTGGGGGALCKNAERLLVLCLLENDGLVQMIREFTTSVQFEGLTIDQLKQGVSHVAQLITSIPDRARPQAPASLSSHMFFKHILNFLMEEMRPSATEINRIWMLQLCSSGNYFPGCAGEALPNVRTTLALLSCESATDAEAYWVLWMCYHHVYKHQPSIRSMFTEKFLLWKVFPVRCLNWIIHFAIIQRKPGTSAEKGSYETRVLLETVQRVASAWSKQEFVQSAPVEQQVHVTAALGLCLDKMSKKTWMQLKMLSSILKGVTCRLESADYMVRKMGSNIALVFSKVIDPQNPLYLDDSGHEGPVDWEFGLADKERKPIVASASQFSHLLLALVV